MKIVDKNGLKISSTLYDFINKEVIPDTEIDIDDFWDKFSAISHELSPINRDLIKKREDIQKKINEWHKANAEKDFNSDEYFKFLKSISYIIEPGEDFEISTTYSTSNLPSILQLSMLRVGLPLDSHPIA